MFDTPLNDIRAFNTRKREWIPITVQVTSRSVVEKSQSSQEIGIHRVSKGKAKKRNKNISKVVNIKNTRLRNRYRRWLPSVSRAALLSSSFPSSVPKKQKRLLGPTARYFHASVLVARDKTLYIQGGMNKTDYLSDFWRFDTIQRIWQPLFSSWNSLCCVGGRKFVIENVVRS